MKPISTNDIESEISYAFLHAVASKAGLGCGIGTRHDDNHGIDATLTAWEVGADKDEIDIKVQLKAKKGAPINNIGHISYFLRESAANPNKRYNELRAETKSTHRILVVLFLPDDETQWINVTAESLIIKNCAYWVSLRGAAAPAGNGTGQTVYIPETQIFNRENLKIILDKIIAKTLTYTLP